MIQGFLDFVQSFRIYGWAYDSQNPDRHLAVEIMCGNKSLGHARADRFREDLKAGSIGKGDHAFVLDLTEPLSNDDLQDISARVITPDGHVVLARLTYTPMESSAGDAEDDAATDTVFQGAASDDTQYPLFILGSARSGTSAFSEAIATTGKFWGQAEGHLLDLFAHLRDSLRAFYDQKQRAGAINGANFISQVPIDFFQKGLRHVFVELMRTTVPSAYWFDKTPNHHMIQLAPHFLAIWPNAKFVFLKRRAPEFIESRRRKFPGMSFEESCRSWTIALQSWAAVRDRLQGHAMEIDQLCMATSPDTIAANVAAFLGFDREQTRRFNAALTVGRPQLTGRDAATVLRPDDLRWSSEEWAIFNAVCAPVMERFGYGWEEGYRLPPSPDRGLTTRPH